MNEPKRRISDKVHIAGETPHPTTTPGGSCTTTTTTTNTAAGSCVLCTHSLQRRTQYPCIEKRVGKMRGGRNK